MRWDVIGVQLVLLKTNPTWSNKMSSKIAKQMIAMINNEDDFMFVVLDVKMKEDAQQYLKTLLDSLMPMFRNGSIVSVNLNTDMFEVSSCMSAQALLESTRDQLKQYGDFEGDCDIDDEVLEDYYHDNWKLQQVQLLVLPDKDGKLVEWLMFQCGDEDVYCLLNSMTVDDEE